MALTSCASCREVVDAAACRCPSCDVVLKECRSIRSFAPAALLGLALAACAGQGGPQPDYGVPITDDDGDGYDSDEDCDDGDPAVNPGATEVPGNAVDDDCDGTVDESEEA